MTRKEAVDLGVLTQKRMYTLLSVFASKRVSEIADERGVNSQSISQELAILRDHGFLVKDYDEFELTELGADVIDLIIKHNDAAILALRDDLQVGV